MSIISVNGVTKHYALGTQTVEALRGVSFVIKKGEFIAIMGPSGLWQIYPYEYHWLP